jgi:hypothetical protein
MTYTTPDVAEIGYTGGVHSSSYIANTRWKNDNKAMNDPVHLISAKITFKRDFKTLETVSFLCAHTKAAL